MAEYINKDDVILQRDNSTKICSNCGGDLVFSPEKQLMVCRFCLTEFDVVAQTDQVVERQLDDFDRIAHDYDWGVETKLMECENCGGRTVSDTREHTTYCAFCGSQHIVKYEGETSSGLKPQGLVPYSVGYKQASKLLGKWVGNRWLAPNDLKRIFLGKGVTGVYMPYWTFDKDTHTDYSVEIGTRHRDSKGDYYTTWRRVAGSYDHRFDDFLVFATDTKYKKLINKIEPFYTTNGEIVNYSPEYLAGYQAQKHTILPQDANELAKNGISKEVEYIIKSMCGGDGQRNYRHTVTFSNESFKYILLPIYIAAYEYKNKLYNVLINGQTGEVQGSFPVSVWKVIGVLLLLALIPIFLFYITN